MKNKFAILTLAITILASCGTKEETTSNEAPKTDTTEVTADTNQVVEPVVTDSAVVVEDIAK
jgi:hypothetical protein